MYKEALARLERAERGLKLARTELADERAASVRQSREWSAALHALEAFPRARAAVLDELLRPTGEAEEAERADLDADPAAGASVGRPGGEPAVPADHGVPLPAGKRGPELEGQGRRTVYDGVARRPIPAGWGGTIEGTPGGRDELLDQGSPQERGRGRWGDEPPF